MSDNKNSKVAKGTKVAKKPENLPVDETVTTHNDKSVPETAKSTAVDSITKQSKDDVVKNKKSKPKATENTETETELD